MKENQESQQRNVKTEGGNYNEQIEGHYIQGNFYQVNNYASKSSADPQKKLPKVSKKPKYNNLILLISSLCIITPLAVITLVVKFPSNELEQNNQNNAEDLTKSIPIIVTPEPTPQLIPFKLLVLNANNNEPVPQASVHLRLSNGSPQTKPTDDDGYVTFNIQQQSEVRVFIKKAGFKSIDKILDRIIDIKEVQPFSLIPEKDISDRVPSAISSPNQINRSTSIVNRFNPSLLPEKTTRMRERLVPDDGFSSDLIPRKDISNSELTPNSFPKQINRSTSIINQSNPSLLPEKTTEMRKRLAPDDGF